MKKVIYINLILDLNNSALFTFIVSITGLIGFIMTIFVAIRTKKIDVKLEHITAAKSYNRNKVKYREKFKGHKASIDNSGLSRGLVTDILADFYSFREQYKIILSYPEKFKINFVIIKYLESNYYKLDSHKINQHLAYIIGRLSKEEKTQ